MIAAGRPRSHWPVVWALSIGFFLVSIDGSIIVIATPDLMSSLNADADIALWTTSAYLLCSAAPLLLFGRWGDRFGRGRVYLLGLLGFILASALCAMSSTIGILIASRALQGIAAAAMAPQSLAIIRDVTPRHRLGTAMGTWSSSAGLANVLGPLTGGLLVAWAGWRTVFIVNIPIGLALLVFSFFVVPRGSRRATSMDTAGVALSFFGIALIVIGMQQGDRFAWGRVVGPISIPLLIVLGLIALVFFVLLEHRRGADGVLPLAVFRTPGYAAGLIGVAAVAMIVTAVPIPLSLAAQNGLGLSPFDTALLQLPVGIGALVLAMPVGRMIDRRGAHRIATCGIGLYALTGCGIGLAIGTTSRLSIVIATTCFGIANALVWASLSVLSMARVPERLTGPASAGYGAARQIGAVLGAAGVTAIIQTGLTRRLPDDPVLRSLLERGAVPVEAVGTYIGAMASSVIAISLIGALAVVVLLASSDRPEPVARRMLTGRRRPPGTGAGR